MPQGCVKCIMSFELILSNTNYAPSSKERNTYRTYTSFNFTHFISLHISRFMSHKIYQNVSNSDDMIDWRCDDWSGLLRHRSVGSAGPAGDDQRGAATSFFPSPVATGRNGSQRLATRRNGSPSQRVAIIVALWWHFLGVIVCGPLANFSDDSAMRICLHLKSNRQMSSSNYSSRFGNRGAQSLLGQADHCGLLSDQHFRARRQLGSGAGSRQSSHAMLRCRQSSWIRRVLEVLEVLEVLPACDANAMHSIWAFSTFSKEMNPQSALIWIQRSRLVSCVILTYNSDKINIYQHHQHLFAIICHYLPMPPMPWSFTRPEFLQAAAAAGPMSPKGDDPHVSSGKCGNAAGPFTLVEPWRAVTGCG